MMKSIILACFMNFVIGELTVIPQGHYRAAVASLPQPSASSMQDYSETIDRMEVLAKDASAAGAQILLFPETTLNTAIDLPIDCSWNGVYQSKAEYIPEISNDTSAEFETPCTMSSWDNRPMSKRLSCIAKEQQIYLVVNMGVALPCSHDEIGSVCPSGNIVFLNSLVTFDTKGQVVSRYFKRHMALEAPGLVQPTPRFLEVYPDNPILKTSFGVSFGLLICFDLAHPYPMNSYIEANVTNILWANQWLTTQLGHQLGAAQGISRNRDINILATGEAHYKSNGVAIFNSGKALAMKSNPQDCTKKGAREMDPKCTYFVFADVPISRSHHEESDNLMPVQTDDGEGTFPCGMFSQKVLTVLNETFANDTMYRLFNEKMTPDNLCRFVDLTPGKLVTATIIAADGSECSIEATLKNDEKPARYILQYGSIPYLSSTPCRTPGVRCTLSSNEAFIGNDYFSNASSFDWLVMNQKIVDRSLSVFTPSIVGDKGVPVDLSESMIAKRGDEDQVIVRDSVLMLSIMNFLGDATLQVWPACNACYSTLEGYPEGRENAFIPINGTTLFDQVMYNEICLDCQDMEGYQNLPEWPPKSTRENNPN